MRSNLALVLLVAGLMAAPFASLAAKDGDDPALWAGTAGAVFPLDKGTPIALVEEELSFTFVPPPRRVLENPRLAESCEVSIVATLRNTLDKPVEVTLAIPEIPRTDPSGAPAIREIDFSVDGRPLRDAAVDMAGPRIPGAPASRVFRTVKLPFEPLKTRTFAALFRMAAPFVGGVTHVRFLAGAQAGFSGGTVGRIKMSFLFGDRVRFVPEEGRTWDLASGDVPGVRSFFYDDGRNTRLKIVARDMAFPATLAFAVTPQGPVFGGTSERRIAQGMRPSDKMTPSELELALATYLAAYGRPLGNEISRLALEERPWGPCNPAYLVAHGEGFGARSVREFLKANACPVNCAEERRKPKDPYGERWRDPVCWYSPVGSLPKTMVTDPLIREESAAIGARLARMTAKAKRAASGGKAGLTGYSGKGCGCAATGRGPSGGLLPLFLAACAAFALARVRG
ncbi:MAG: hypothetical protein PHU25_04760 [Deltaproteobacteria bacterium]|nr:hypothetical protein [Deltaproteobacteria bacterium]